MNGGTGTRPNAPQTGKVPTAVAPREDRYLYQPAYYLKQIAANNHMELAEVLPIASMAGDANRWDTWEDDEKADYLRLVEQAVLNNKLANLPPHERPGNTWADSPAAVTLFKTEQFKIYGATSDDICAALGISLITFLRFYSGNRDRACGQVAAYMKGKKNMPTKETRTAWTPFYAESLNGLAIDNGIAMSQLDQFCKDTLNGKLPEEATKDRHPDSVLKALEDAAPAWAKKWCKTSQDQASLFPATTVALDDVPALSGLDDLEKKAADLPKPEITMPEIVSNEGVGSTEAAKEASTPTAPPVDVVEAEIVEEPLPALEIKDNGSQDGKEYSYVATWTPDSKRWQVALETYVKVWSDEEKKDREEVLVNGLTAQRPGDLSITAKTIDAPVALINDLRAFCQKQVGDAFTLLPGDTMNAQILKAYDGMEGQGAAGALTSFGFNGAKQRVIAMCMKHTEAEAAEINRKAEAENTSRALMVQNQAVAPSTPNLSIVKNDSSIRIPTEPQVKAMMMLSEAAAGAGMFDRNRHTAMLALWRGFELDVPMSTALEGIYVLNGRTWIGDNLIRAVVRRSPLCERFDVWNDTEESAICIARRRGEPERTFKYTKADAEGQGLWGNQKNAWGKNPKSMLRHRLSRSTVFEMWPELAMGIGLDDEPNDDLADAGDLPQAAGF